MFTVADLLPEAQRILGICDRAMSLRRLNSAVELLANKGDFDPYIAVMDIVACGRMVALPPEVETPLSINSCGTPMMGRDRLFSFHLNGPGDNAQQFRSSALRWSWQDMNESPVFTQPITAGRLYATVDNPADSGVNLTVYGLDKYGQRLGRIVAGVFVEGIIIPAFTTPTLPPDPTMPEVARIDRVSKPTSRGIFRLYYYDDVATAGVLLANYDPIWTEPMFRIILLDKPSPWLRILFRRKQRPLKDDSDLIPLHSCEALLAMLQALKYYDDGNIEAASMYEATAVRWLSEEQKTRRASLWIPPQVDGHNTLLSYTDQLI